MVDFSALKRNSQQSLSKLTEELSKINEKGGGKSSEDNRFWKPTVDKAGNGYAEIRFLPAPGDEDMPFVRIWDHGFQGPTGKWYIENSLTTIGKNDPVSEYNSELWAMSEDDNSPSRKQARAQKRRLHFLANIYVVNDKGNPENNGKVFLFKFGKKIFDKLNDLMNPQFDDETPVNPFDFWGGATFKLKIRQVEGYRNYDKSEFSDPAPLLDDDAELEAIWKQEHSLKAFLAPENFKTYDELKKKLNEVLGLAGRTVESREPAREAPVQRAKPAPQAAEEDSPPWTTSSSDAEEEEEASYFAKLRALADED